MKVESRPMRSMTLLTLGSIGLIAVSGSTNAVAGDVRAPQVAGVATVQNDAPTFYGDVVAILQENCQVCHQPERPNLGGVVAPMSLVTYEETRRWASSIAEQVEARLMPPWHASREFRGTFVNERYLEDHEIETLVAWAESGALAGNPADAPPPLALNEVGSSDSWTIGEPDLVIPSPSYMVSDELTDDYIYQRVTISADMLPEDRWIKAVEFRAGGSYVHHIVGGVLGGTAPGYGPFYYPNNVSRTLRTGSTIRFEVHYHKEPGPGTAVLDQSFAAIQFYEPGEVVKNVMRTTSLGIMDFEIPPGDPNYTDSSEFLFEEDSYIHFMNPHMHLRGKSARYVLTYPDGRQEPLLYVPQYDFGWQHNYYLNEPLFVPAGTKVTLTLWWDNSADNPTNPDPTATVTYGAPTTDEMGFGWLHWTEAEARNIVVGESLR